VEPNLELLSKTFISEASAPEGMMDKIFHVLKKKGELGKWFSQSTIFT